MAFFTNRLTPKQLDQLKYLLSQRIEFNPLAIYKFTNSPIGEIVLRNVGTAIKADVNTNGFFALRGAIVQAAFDDDGLTLINVLRRFSLDTIYLDTAVAVRCIEEGAKLLKEKELIVAAIKQKSQAELEQTTKIELTFDRDLSALGSFTR